MDIAFPMYARLDDGDLIRIESIEKILGELEAIDIENDEFLFWDAAGNGVRVVLTGKVGLFRNPKIARLDHAENRMSFQAAALEWANQLGVPLDITGSPEQVWDRFRQAQSQLGSRR